MKIRSVCCVRGSCHHTTIQFLLTNNVNERYASVRETCCACSCFTPFLFCNTHTMASLGESIMLFNHFMTDKRERERERRQHILFSHCVLLFYRVWEKPFAGLSECDMQAWSWKLETDATAHNSMTAVASRDSSRELERAGQTETQQDSQTHFTEASIKKENSLFH